jgi:hypothetical protein
MGEEREGGRSKEPRLGLSIEWDTGVGYEAGQGVLPATLPRDPNRNPELPFAAPPPYVYVCTVCLT